VVCLTDYYSWNVLRKRFDKVYLHIRSNILKVLDNRIIEDYLYYERNISNHFRSGIPYYLGKYFNISKSKIIPVCTLAEMNYCLALIIDDMQDNDNYRWGKPTLFKAKGKSYVNAYYNFVSSKLGLLFKDNVLPIIQDYHNYALWESFFLENKIKFSGQKDIKDVVRVALLKTQTGISANMTIASFADDKFRYNGFFRDVYNYSAYLGIAGQLKDDLTDVSRNKQYKNYARRSDNKNQYVNLLSLGYNKDQILDLIDFCVEKAMTARINFCPDYDNKTISLVLDSWAKVHIDRAKEVIK